MGCLDNKYYTCKGIVKPWIIQLFFLRLVYLTCNIGSTFKCWFTHQHTYTHTYIIILDIYIYIYIYILRDPNEILQCDQRKYGNLTCFQFTIEVNVNTNVGDEDSVYLLFFNVMRSMWVIEWKVSTVCDVT